MSSCNFKDDTFNESHSDDTPNIINTFISNTPIILGGSNSSLNSKLTQGSVDVGQQSRQTPLNQPTIKKVDVMIQYSKGDDYEMVKNIEIERDIQQQIRLAPIINCIALLGLPIRDHLVSYYSHSEQMFVFIGKEPLDTEVVVSENDIDLTQRLVFWCRPANQQIRSHLSDTRGGPSSDPPSAITQIIQSEQQPTTPKANKINTFAPTGSHFTRASNDITLIQTEPRDTPSHQLIKDVEHPNIIAASPQQLVFNRTATAKASPRAATQSSNEEEKFSQCSNHLGHQSYRLVSAPYGPAHPPNNNNVSPIQKKPKDRSVQNIIDKVSLWRKSYSEVQTSDKSMARHSLKDAAYKVGMTKKSLHAYSLQLRFGKKFGFDFQKHKNDKVGILRSFVKKEKSKLKSQGKSSKLKDHDNFDFQEDNDQRGANIDTYAQQNTLIKTQVVVNRFVQNFQGMPVSLKDVTDYFQQKFEFIASQPQQNIKMLKVNQDSNKNFICMTQLLLGFMSNRKVIPTEHTIDLAADFPVVCQLVSRYLVESPIIHIKVIIAKYFQVASMFTEYLLDAQKPLHGIKTLKTAIQKLQDDPEQICGSLHRDFAKLCLKAKCYLHSLPIISPSVTSFKKQTSPMDILGYIYYKGMLYVGLKEYEKGLEQFMLVLGYPSDVTHKVHVESYKKAVLLNLLVGNSKHLPFPENTHQMLKYKLETCIPVYKAFANAFISKELETLTDIIQANHDDMSKDKNMGLVKKVLNMYPQVRVQELSNIYLTLTFDEMANMVQAGKEETNQGKLESLVFQMISQGQTKARINCQQKMVYFIDTSTSSDHQSTSKNSEYLEVIETMERQNKRIIELMTQVQEVDRGIQVTPIYMKRTLLGKEGPKGSGVLGGDLDDQFH